MTKIRELRKEKGLTMKELGKILNLSESTISLYENGKHSPDHDTLVKIAEFFNVSTDYLLGRVTSDSIKSADFHVGLSKAEESSLTDTEKEEIKKFAEFVINKRK